MRVAGRLALGSLFLLAVLGGVLAYDGHLVGRVVEANHNLAAVTFRAARVSLELERQLDRIEEFTRKLFVTRDGAYAAKVMEARDRAAARMHELSQLDLTAGETAALAHVRAVWSRTELARATDTELVAAVAATGRETTLQSLTEAFEDLAEQAQALSRATGEAITGQVIAAEDVGRHAEQVSVAVIAASLLCTLVIIGLTVHSITTPLRRLTEGTREVARGRFTTQLAVAGPVEFAHLAEDFNSMVRRLGELDSLKREFVSHVSHELRTPLVAMQETNRLLLEETVGPLAARQRRLLELNLLGSQRLARMISNLLDLTRLEAGALRYRFEVRDARELARAAAGELESWARERGVRIVQAAPAGPCPVRCDADRVVQVLVDLVDNAVRHSPAGRNVELTVVSPAARPAGVPASCHRELADSPAGFVAIGVADHGPGVRPADREKVFERFFRAGDGSAGSGGGLGLGLSICRQHVEAHHGALWVEDGPGGGAVFTVLLPREADAAEREPAAPGAGQVAS